MNNSGITSEPISHLSITAILILNAVSTDSSSERRSLKPSKRALNPYFVKYTLLSSFADLTEVVYSMEFPPLLFSMPPAVGPRSQFHILLFKDISLLKVVLQQLIINNFLSSEVIRTFKTGESSLNLCNKRSKTLLLIRISFSSSKQPTRHRISSPGSGVTKSLAAGNKTLKASSFLFFLSR
ncbi:hypothetical protein AWRI1631_43590 [Saccharomyces cerevisiae AWRI1631]|uniref:Uncharacterized protein n=1 Tax=Saccharomyces cerevisiae (strain AWRI1631) TaxID=545124 RepID=B5VG37_YEAS6|nr:hypothetical protein AWRI1631_43590 [Saccharomyces cerevisiae AWRI1631]